MQEPTVAPVVEIELGGEAHTLKFGFRAYEAMGLNPFDPDSIAAYQTQTPSPRMIATVVQAGMLHQYTKLGAKHGQQPPSVDDVLDMLDMFVFVGLWERIQKAMGTDEEPKPEGQTADPQTA